MTMPDPDEMGYAEIVVRELPTIAALCRQFRVRRLDLFGSAVGDRFDAKRSDIDLLVEFEPMLPGGYADAYFGLREALETLFERKVDLVTEPALKNPYLRRRIASQKRALFRCHDNG
jgi:predicted nucleotidyltransferase